MIGTYQNLYTVRRLEFWQTIRNAILLKYCTKPKMFY